MNKPPKDSKDPELDADDWAFSPSNTGNFDKLCLVQNYIKPLEKQDGT